jgi:L-aspartate oxidase
VAARARRESVGAHFRSDGTPAQAPERLATARGATAPRAHTADLSKEPVAC